MNTMTVEAAREALLKRIYYDTTLRVWLRAKCRCEYCGRDMRADGDTYQMLSNLDHVTPSRSGTFENLAVSCCSCNDTKRRQDFSDGGRITDRDEIIARARVYIAEKRADWNAHLAQESKWLDVLLADKATGT